MLISNEQKDLSILKYPLTNARVMASTSSKSSIIIYGDDKVLLFLPIEDFAGIMITNKETHVAYKVYFNLLWKQSKLASKNI